MWMSEVIAKSTLEYVSAHIENAENMGLLKAGSECIDTVKKYSSNFTEYSNIIVRMVYYSGKDINDLGK